MHPDLFSIGPFPIRAYGLLMALSFFLGVFYIKKMTERDNKPFEPYLTIAYIMILGGVIGARVFYVLTHLGEFQGRWSNTINPFAGEQFGIAGLSLYGGVLLAIFGTLAYCYWKKLSILEVFDYFSPTLALGIGVSRIGCFFNGCCFGTPTDLPWGVTFPIGSIPYYIFGDVSIHPSQLYSSLYGFVLFVIMHFMLKKKKFTGQVVAIMFMSEALFRYSIEFVRYYQESLYFEFFGTQPTYNQLVSVSLFIAGILIYYIQNKKSKTA